ncbi:hypothetical protein B0H65DRAFT_445996 [Neurospora tetraspora]|uniref:Uncharacterized protein n=1 Tax=Neurospora tetraspora TaxID=94610 RepID=A0AAE0J6Z9_9PEZI|nr:hypothetical protein B0H65DRAFT_445996 [Neurospora tetraspora]
MGLNFPLGVGCLGVLGVMPGVKDKEKGGGGGGDSEVGEAGEDSEEGPLLNGDGGDDTNKNGTNGSMLSLLSSVKRGSTLLSELLTHDRRVLVLLATVPIAKCINPVEELMVQYIPRRFDISLASRMSVEV